MAETVNNAARNITIQGIEFSIPQPYGAGHVLTENEARHLNQTYAENVRNNFAKTVKASLDGAEGAVSQADLPSAFADYVGKYSLDQVRAVASGSSRTLDPVEKEARQLAKDIVKNALAKQGAKLTAPKEASDEEKAAYTDRINAKIEEIAAREEVIAAAKKNVNNRSKNLDSLAATLEL